MSLLALVVTVGLVASGITAVCRAIAPVELLLLKPLSCDLCMSWWSSLATVVFLAVFGGEVGLVQSVVAVFGGVGVSLLAVKTANRLAT